MADKKAKKKSKQKAETKQSFGADMFPEKVMEPTEEHRTEFLRALTFPIYKEFKQRFEEATKTAANPTHPMWGVRHINEYSGRPGITTFFGPQGQAEQLQREGLNAIQIFAIFNWNYDSDINKRDYQKRMAYPQVHPQLSDYIRWFNNKDIEIINWQRLEQIKVDYEYSCQVLEDKIKPMIDEFETLEPEIPTEKTKNSLARISCGFCNGPALPHGLMCLKPRSQKLTCLECIRDQIILLECQYLSKFDRIRCQSKCREMAIALRAEDEAIPKEDKVKEIWLQSEKCPKCVNRYKFKGVEHFCSTPDSNKEDKFTRDTQKAANAIRNRERYTNIIDLGSRPSTSSIIADTSVEEEIPDNVNHREVNQKKVNAILDMPNMDDVIANLKRGTLEYMTINSRPYGRLEVRYDTNTKELNIELPLNTRENVSDFMDVTKQAFGALLEQAKVNLLLQKELENVKLNKEKLRIDKESTEIELHKVQEQCITLMQKQENAEKAAKLTEKRILIKDLEITTNAIKESNDVLLLDLKRKLESQHKTEFELLRQQFQEAFNGDQSEDENTEDDSSDNRLLDDQDLQLMEPLLDSAFKENLIGGKTFYVSQSRVREEENEETADKRPPESSPTRQSKRIKRNVDGSGGTSI